MQKTMTICAKCQHFVTYGEVWYDQFCQASPLQPRIDPVTGKAGYQAMNDLGRVLLTDKPYAYARDINTDGCCPLYTSRG